MPGDESLSYFPPGATSEAGPHRYLDLIKRATDAAWMQRKGYPTLDDMRGILAVPDGTEQAAYERAGYVRALRAANAGHGPW